MWAPPIPRAASSGTIPMGDRCSALRALRPLTALRGGGIRHPRKVERLRSDGAAGGLPLSDDGRPRAESEGQMRAASGDGLEGRGARMAQATARRPRRASSHGAHGEQQPAAMPAAADSSNEEMSETGATSGLGAGGVHESTPNDEDAVEQQLDRLGREHAASPPPQWGGGETRKQGSPPDECRPACCRHRMRQPLLQRFEARDTTFFNWRPRLARSPTSVQS